MKITMLSIGSYGDVLPYIVLGKELQKRGNEITICAFSDFRQGITDAGLLFQPLFGDSKNFISELMNGADGLAYLKRATDILSKTVDPLMESIWKACENADGIISTFLGEVVQSVAEAMNKPFLQTHFYPMDKTADTAISAAPFRKMGKNWNLFSYDLADSLISALEKHFLDDWRREHGLPTKKIQAKRNYFINGHYVPVIYAIPPQLYPRPKEWPEHIYMTGFWREEQDFTPDPLLVRFIQNGSKPIYIGFGSMNDDHMQETMDIVLRALKIAKLRAVISAGWGNAEIQPDENVYPVHYVSHSWLFEQVCATVHHGGAGTTATSLYAGKPMLIIPFSGDQPFWGERIHLLKIGPAPIERRTLNANKLSRALLDLVHNGQYLENAIKMKRELIDSHPVQDAASIIEKEFSQW